MRRAGVETARALEAGPDPDRPAEDLVDEPGGTLRSARPGVSVAMVSRRTGLTPQAKRDLAATRRLEAPFVSFGLGPVDVSAIAVRTASGVLRAVPGRPVQVGRNERRGTGFRVPVGGHADPRRPAGARGPRSGRVVGRLRGPVLPGRADRDGDDARARRRRQADRRGRRRLDVRRLFEGPPDPARPDDVEILLSARRDRAARRLRAGRLPDADLRALSSAIVRRGVGELETELGGRHFLVAARRVPPLSWVYAKVSPRAALERKVRGRAGSDLRGGSGAARRAAPPLPRRHPARSRARSSP